MVDLTSAARIAAEEHRAAPCAVVAAAQRREGGWVRGAGHSGRLTFDEGSPLVTPETPFDLASVSKPFTALTFARLVRAGVVGRDEPLASLLPWLGATRSANTSLDLLSAHRAGLEAHRTLYSPLEAGHRVSVEASLAICAEARRVECVGEPPPDGFPPVYSDLGYLLLGAALAERTGMDLDALVEREVIAPLGLTVGSARQMQARYAAVGAIFEDQVAPTEVVPYRGGLVRGRVHDDNAWSLSGLASSGHAGLFGNARSIVDLGVAVLEALRGERRDWLSPEDLAPVLRPRPGGSHRAGFDSKSGEAPSSGKHFGERTFGHLGFTGTSLWMDPDQGLVGVLLCNRVHPSRESIAIRAARPAAYDAMAEGMGVPTHRSLG